MIMNTRTLSRGGRPHPALRATFPSGSPKNCRFFGVVIGEGYYKRKDNLKASPKGKVDTSRRYAPPSSVRNSRLPSLSFGTLLCSQSLRLASSPTGCARLRLLSRRRHLYKNKGLLIFRRPFDVSYCLISLRKASCRTRSALSRPLRLF